MKDQGQEAGQPAGSSAAQTVLRCSDLVKRFGKVTAVAGISLEVRRGECFGLLGPNGAGKTTTMEMLEGLTPPDSGTVEILGRRWDGAEARLLRERLGIQLQQTELPERLTVVEILRMFRSFFPRGPRVSELLSLVSLHEKRDARLGGLSGGQKQRLSLACALAGAPDLLFLDEPTTGLDPQARLAVWNVVGRFLSRGGSVLITTHYMEEAARLCERLAIVDRGRIIALDSPAGLIASAGSGQKVEIELAEPGLEGEALSELPAVASAAGHGRAFTLGSRDVGATLPALFSLVERRANRIVRLTTRESTLEDVFVALTGRALRDG